ncbi:MAG: hypothetical protein V4513_06810 [Pseudomonadota bacterium]
MSYRLYRLDGAGKITTGEWVEATDDQSAVQAARESCAPGKYELWQRNRFIATISKPVLEA